MISKKETTEMIKQWDNMIDGPEKNKFWDKLYPYINAHKEIWINSRRKLDEEKEKNKDEEAVLILEDV